MSFSKLGILLSLGVLTQCSSFAPKRHPASNTRPGKYSGLEMSLTEVPFDLPGSDIVVKMSYDLDCPKDAYLAPGYIQLPRKKVRFNLFKGQNQAESILASDGDRDLKASVVFDQLEDARTCSVTRFEWMFQTFEEYAAGDSALLLALKNAPFVSSRYDLYGDPFNDVPLMLGYSFGSSLSNKQRDQLVYEIVFADQDMGKTSLEAIRAQTANWSRRTDIEWVYQVEFDKGSTQRRDANILHPWKFVTDDRVVDGSILKLDFLNPSAPKSFSGRYIFNTDHPITYNVGPHHNFSSRPRSDDQKQELMGYHFVPKHRFYSPNPREDLVFMAPWTFKVNEWELKNRKLLEDTSDEYLYVKITGDMLKSGSWMPYVHARKLNEFRVIGRGEKAMNHLDKSNWMPNKSMYASIYVGKGLIKRMLNGSETLAFYLDTSHGPKAALDGKKPNDLKFLKVDKLEFFVLKDLGDDYEVQNLSERFTCLSQEGLTQKYCVSKSP